MAIGTAGYTAMLSILALEKHGIRPEDGDILVTGASGGVGSIAVTVLGKLGIQGRSFHGEAGGKRLSEKIGSFRDNRPCHA